MSRRGWLLWAGLNLLIAGFWALTAWTESYCWFGDDCAERLAAPLRRIAWTNGAYWLLVANALWGLVWALRRRRYLVAGGCAAALLAAWPAKAGLRRLLTPDYYAILRFERVSEEYTTNVVALAGYPIGPYLLRSARTPAARERRTAIKGLGQLDYQPAVPVLDSILRNEREPDYIRADALLALRRMSGPPVAALRRRFHQQAGRDLAAHDIEQMVDQ